MTFAGQHDGGGRPHPAWPASQGARRETRGLRSFLRALASGGRALLVGSALALAGGHVAPAQAQTPVLSPGDAVVTGFSGIRLAEGVTPAGGDPLAEFFIDLEGPSAQIFRLSAAAAPQGQLIQAESVFKVTAGQVGQVFAITLDDAETPGIYLGATSAFGIQIVLPDADGDGAPERVRAGHPNAVFMDGQFGPGDEAGPGSIWKVDGATGAVTLFATIEGNSGPGLGDIVFDKELRQFYVSDLDTGLIHRLDEDGQPVDTFDHGVDGRAAAGLSEIADDGRVMDITKASFNSEDSGTWGFTQSDRRVWGMAVHQGRLYYGVWKDMQIWSVGVTADGFADDARLEIEVAGAERQMPITDMVFDSKGALYVAQRGGVVGRYDYSMFAEAKRSKVMRFTQDATGKWSETPEDYAIGFPPDFLNASGGIDLGYGHNEAGAYDRGRCDDFLWATGDALRNDPALAAELEPGGPLVVHGLQGNDKTLARPDNAPPWQSYFVDYDDRFEDPQAQGHVGDVEVFRPCGGKTGWTPPASCGPACAPGTPDCPCVPGEPCYPPCKPGGPCYPVCPIGAPGCDCEDCPPCLKLCRPGDPGCQSYEDGRVGLKCAPGDPNCHCDGNGICLQTCRPGDKDCKCPLCPSCHWRCPPGFFWNGDKCDPSHAREQSHWKYASPVHTRRQTHLKYASPHSRRESHKKDGSPVHLQRESHLKAGSPVHSSYESHLKSGSPVHTKARSHYKDGSFDHSQARSHFKRGSRPDVHKPRESHRKFGSKPDEHSRRETHRVRGSGGGDQHSQRDTHRKQGSGGGGDGHRPNASHRVRGSGGGGDGHRPNASHRVRGSGGGGQGGDGGHKPRASHRVQGSGGQVPR